MKRCKVGQRRTWPRGGVPGMLHLFVLLGVLQLACRVSAQLIINVQNQGGEIVQETITSSVGDDTCTLEFQRSDGTLVTKLIDFKSEVQVLKALVLGEEERGQSQYQVMCFVTKFQKGDFITADAMAKLRQKNPSTIRTPEEDRGKENYTMTGWVQLDRAAPISRHVAPLCAEAQESTYVRDTDLKAWAELPGDCRDIALHRERERDAETHGSVGESAVIGSSIVCPRGSFILPGAGVAHGKERERVKKNCLLLPMTGGPSG
ncbi:out at first protein-like isoform X2 [Anopheles albimanus]|uniref:out at first protein-like isoform X2 n=1 Tax=Anopheles albimanus TaxID=7167 RepID=UPI00163E168D|nr:out at first protein-like isoform X2 [Anopheles albimanus]